MAEVRNASVDVDPRMLKFILTIVVGVLISVSAPLLRTLWASKVDSSTYREHVRDFDRFLQQDSIWKVEQKELLVDILCARTPGDSRCFARLRKR